MAMLLDDPLAGYGSLSDLIAKGGWVMAGNPNWLPTGGPYGYAALSSQGVGNSWRRGFATASGPVVWQGRFKVSAITGDASAGLIFYVNSAATAALRVNWTAAGALRVYDANGTVVHTGVAAQVTAGIWHYLAVQADVGSPTGNLKVWLNQPSPTAAPACGLSMVDLYPAAGSGCDAILLAGENTTYWGDFFVLDATPTGPTGYQGEKRWLVLSPNATGASQQWSASGATGANYMRVDDSPYTGSDGDYTHVYGSSGAGLDLYGHQDVPTGTDGIVWVTQRVDARKSDAGDAGVMQLVMRAADGATATSPALVLNSSAYTHHRFGMGQVPGATGWDRASVDALQAGFVI